MVHFSGAEEREDIDTSPCTLVMQMLERSWLLFWLVFKAS